MTDDYVIQWVGDEINSVDDACHKANTYARSTITRTLICMSNIYLRVILIFNGREDIYHI